MENSLTENKIGLFCEDFLRLLNFNQKKHKERVPCLVGEPDSGKTSLFYPILRLIHHSNAATVTKQKVFKKAMIGKNTEVIFIDGATPSTLDVDDWKILTQGGYTACDVKYKTAKSFFNRCPLFMPAQQKLQFKEEDQQGMDRRLRYYFFKRLSSPKKQTAQWLRKHPMECVVWAASKARVDTDEEESSDDDDEDAERNTPNDEGPLLETEKEVLRNVQLTDLLADLRANPRDDEDTAGDDNGDQIVDADDDDETTHALKNSLAQTLPGSLDNRHLSLLLEKHLQQNEERMRREIQRHERHQQRLRSKGVSEENERLLPHNPNEPLPTPIRNDLAIHEQMTARADRKEKKRAREAFQSAWLRNTERELNECMVTLESSIMLDMRDSMDALCEILEEKLKDHHNNLGTLGCQEALAERKKVCVELGLLRKENQHMVKTLFEALPVPSSSQREEMEEILEQEKPRTPNYVPQDNLEQYGMQSPCTFSYVTGSDDDDDEQLFITPSTAPRAYSLSSAPKRSYQKRRSQPPTSSPMPKRGRITHLFSLSQQ